MSDDHVSLSGDLRFAPDDDLAALDAEDAPYYDKQGDTPEDFLGTFYGFTIYESDQYHTAAERAAEGAFSLIGESKWQLEISGAVFALRGEKEAARRWVREKRSGESFFRVHRIDAVSMPPRRGGSMPPHPFLNFWELSETASTLGQPPEGEARTVTKHYWRSSSENAPEAIEEPGSIEEPWLDDGGKLELMNKWRSARIGQGLISGGVWQIESHTRPWAASTPEADLPQSVGLNLQIYNGNTEADLARFRVQSVALRKLRLERDGGDLGSPYGPSWLTLQLRKKKRAKTAAKGKCNCGDRVREVMAQQIMIEVAPHRFINSEYARSVGITVGHGQLSYLTLATQPTKACSIPNKCCGVHILRDIPDDFKPGPKFPSGVPGVAQRDTERDAHFRDMEEFGRCAGLVPESDEDRRRRDGIKGNVKIDPRESLREPKRIEAKCCPAPVYICYEPFIWCVPFDPMWAQATPWRKSENRAERNKFLLGGGGYWHRGNLLWLWTTDPHALKVKDAVAKVLHRYDEGKITLEELAKQAHKASCSLRRKRPIGKQVIAFRKAQASEAIANIVDQQAEDAIIAATRVDGSANRFAVFRPCMACGEGFTPRRTDAKYCSVACRQAAYRERQSVTDNQSARVSDKGELQSSPHPKPRAEEKGQALSRAA